MRVAILDTPAALSWDETKAAMGPGDRGYPVTGTDDEGWLAAATAALADGPVDGVVAFSEPHVVAAALIAEELGLPGPGVRAAVVSRNKLMQRELFGRAGLAQPAHFHARDADAAAGFAAGRWPVIAKPLSGSGSHGVQVLGDESELRAWAAGHGDRETFLVEEFLDGPEVSVEALLVDGEVRFSNVTDKTVSGLPFRVELEHHVPAALAPAVRAAIERVLIGVTTAIGLRTGVVHLELILQAGGPSVVEIAARTPGDYLMDVIEAATGVDLYDAVIAAACGLPLEIGKSRPDVASVWFPTPAAGTVESIEGAESIDRMPGVVKIEIDVLPGDEVHPLRSSMDRVGMVIYRAPDRDGLDDLLTAIRSRLIFKIR
ncbi:biotin carboxylase [Actinoplanes lutulentus]|uniref:Biotin carboxylase n=2 Tax=Actinoplanes lutulentus TaxID=1287878 RepID=A0A327ZCZ9_9ACTN|nr:biotin carboxylase [Actinoplanes lutulentus]RAK38266.1 biotin carboxylase [Actinoplanes lutulentus]